MEPGTYNLTVEDNNGCTVSNSYTVEDNILSLEIIIESTDNVTCNGGNDGSIVVSGTGGQEPYEYRVNNGAWQATGVFNGLSTGTYNIEIKDANDCTETIEINIDEPTVPTSQSVITICDSYNWNNQTYTETGTYSYQTQNNDGCDSIAFLYLTIYIYIYK